MSTVRTEPLLHHDLRGIPRFHLKSSILEPASLSYSRQFRFHGRRFSSFKPPRKPFDVKASSSVAAAAAVVETFDFTDIFFSETFPLKWTEIVEGWMFVRLDKEKNKQNWQLTVGCRLPGKWILHWGVSYVDDVGSEWDQPPTDMRPSGSVSIQDYAIETPLLKAPSTTEGEDLYEVKISIKPDSTIAAINFVLKDEETGAWCQHEGRDFKVSLVDFLRGDNNIIGEKKGFGIWKGRTLRQLSNIFLGGESSHSKENGSNSVSNNDKQDDTCLGGFYEELPLVKQVPVHNSVSVSVRKCPNSAKNILYLETDLPGDVVVHWGVCRDDTKKWEIPAAPHPPKTTIFRSKALRTLLKKKEGLKGCSGLFTLDKDISGFLFVLMVKENTWLNSMGNDFFVPLSNSSNLVQSRKDQYETTHILKKTDGGNEEVSDSVYTDGVINEIRNFVSDISSEKNCKTKTKEPQESILQMIEKLAAEAYSFFRSSMPTFSEEAVLEREVKEYPSKVPSGTGSGYDILCQGFNWESSKSKRWYKELKEKVKELSSLGFSIVWLPPPTESVSPEGYMPKDLYNLNSRYGTVEELKDLVKKFHDVNIKVLGDVVLNHRCAHYKNQNGAWNIFGGRLNWDDRAVVADDPHFQGRGNKKSGEFFHAAPNIDHSQDFVRRDLKEWLCWLRKEIRYDGWRLDFVRGFSGGYMKDYLEASEPYFAVGEFWDSLSYSHGVIDHNQDAHRQRIIDWINSTNGTAGAFDITTKGILHSVSNLCSLLF
ncbi:hypothetical protein SAY87_020133 [Trapa incisa]|uniref:1,4-alpha-D-glucan glucanohydrolase n=1 Tax=Trapa incisa TaxID=236973 RepID=A0AAN7K3F8_9MYRT|nr:hypothetical protein SAY87_020133 [Trapa incisa]